MDWLPSAKRENHNRSNSWAEKTDPKGCLHTTEGSDWPTYRDWTVMPHATVKPIPGKGVEIHQHVPFSQASFALRNLDGGVQTNRDCVFQFELIGTCEQGGPGYYWPAADNAVLLDLYEKVIAPLSSAFDIPLRARPFQAYPASYGAASGSNNVRMSGASFDTYSGWLGHQHVPENVHGDPGAFPWDRMMEVAMTLSDNDKAWIEKTIKANSLTLAELFDGTIKLSTQARVDAWNAYQPDTSKWLKLGDTVDLETIIVWGNVGSNRERAQIRDGFDGVTALVEQLGTKVDELTAKLDTPPAP
jgi:hypothetical protein